MFYCLVIGNPQFREFRYNCVCVLRIAVLTCRYIQVKKTTTRRRQAQTLLGRQTFQGMKKRDMLPTVLQLTRWPLFMLLFIYIKVTRYILIFIKYSGKTLKLFIAR